MKGLAAIFIFFCGGIFAQDPDWKLNCTPKKVTIHINHSKTITCEISGPKIYSEHWLVVNSSNPSIVEVNEQIWLEVKDKKIVPESFNVSGVFLGKGRVIVRVKQRSVTAPIVETSIEAIVIRQKRVIDVIFHVSVAILVTVMYVNFGCALKWNELRNSLKRPVGPAIGFIGQFLFMPLLSFFIGRLLFPRNPEMQLGMFFTGVSPGGGASNMWAVILGLNIDLSITMTTISTFGAFAMMPIWLFTLGKVIFDDAKLDVPYQMISMYAMTLVVPLFIGFLIQKYMKPVAAFLVRILKTFSALLLIFIVVFAIVTNLYLFKLFSWQILVAGLGLPWLGYTVAWLLAIFFKQPNKDALVIAIETGIQNTGISIYLLRFCLSQPEADLTTVVPVAVAIMTPIPLLLLWIAQKFRNRCFKKRKYTPHENSELNSPLSEMSVDNHFAPSTIS